MECEIGDLLKVAIKQGGEKNKNKKKRSFYFCFRKSIGKLTAISYQLINGRTLIDDKKDRSKVCWCEKEA